MSLANRTGLVIIAAVLLLGVALGFLIPAVEGELTARRGTSQALADIDAGKLQYKLFGIPRRWSLEAARDIEEACGVDVSFMDAGDHHVFEYWKRYNAEIRRHLTERHGRDVVSEILAKHVARRHEDGAEPLRATDAAVNSDGGEE
jgi:hypothetical protein